jgi:predicted phosphohydrolase
MLWAISDLHLSLGGEKPMDIFGEQWEDHHLKIKENWQKSVENGDTVILGGDLSWALKLEEAGEDFNFIHGLPGRKVLFKGNHDYWWQSYAKVNKALPAGICAVQNNYFLYEGRIALCGTRGWTAPGGENYTSQDEKIYRRELMRLEMSLSRAQKDGYSDFIVTLHYPPFTLQGKETGFVDIMRQYNVKICLYGHLHGVDQQRVFQGERDRIMFYFISCDFLKFDPLLIDLSIFEKS